MSDARIDGRLVEELDMKPNETPRSYWNGDVDLEGARLKALGDVTEAEQAVVEALEGFKVAEREASVAMQTVAEANLILGKRRATLMAMRQNLAWRLGFVDTQ